MPTALRSTDILFNDGTTQSTAAVAYGGPNRQVFTSSGTFTVPSGVTAVIVTVTGAGGGCTQSGNPASSGSAGGTAIRRVTGLTPGGTVAVTVGTSTTSGTAGTSSFGAFCSATGGVAGSNNSNGAEGGLGSSGDINIRGGGAFYGRNVGYVDQMALAGGASYWGGGAPAYSSSAALGAGGGGRGGYGSGTQLGGNGIVVVEW